LRYSDILLAADAFLKLANRIKGKSLRETDDYPGPSVSIYRAVKTPILYFGKMDYVSLSRKFAIGHAEHMAAVEEEPYQVITAMVSSSDVYEAHNPGEYFYDGPLKKGYRIYVAKGI